MVLATFNALILVFVTVLSEGLDLPSYFPKCNIDDPKLNDCILNATRTLKSRLSKGVGEITLPSFDPLEISAISIKQNWNDLRYKVLFRKFSVRGLDDYDFDEITYDPITLTLAGKVRFNNIVFVTNYEGDGFVFYFPVVGNGILESKIDWINGTFEIKGKLRRRKHRQYYFPTSSKVRMTIKGFSLYLTGLFDDNPELGHLTNELLFLNRDMIADAITPVFERLTEEFLMGFLKTLTKRVPYNKLFPHS